LTVYAALGPLGLISCQLHSWDSPFRAFPFQQAVPLSRSVLPCGLESPGRSWPSRFARHGWPPIGRGQDDIARYDVCSCQRRRWSPTASLSFQRSFDPAPARSNLAVGSAGLQSPVAASVQAGNPARHQHPERLLRSEAFLLLKVRSRHESGCPTRERRCSPGIFPLQSLLPSRVRSGSPADARTRTTDLLPASSHRPLTSLAAPAGRSPSKLPEPQSLKQREDWLVPLGTTCSPRVSHLVGVSRQFKVSSDPGLSFLLRGDALSPERLHPSLGRPVPQRRTLANPPLDVRTVSVRPSTPSPYGIPVAP